METNIEKILLNTELVSSKKLEIEKDILKIISKDESQLLDFVSNYIHWNGLFAGCVINLASRFHLGIDFGLYEPNSPEEDFFQTRGHRVAGLIFAAAEDEYSDEHCEIEGVRIEHKTMAWFTLNKMYEFFNLDITKRKIHPLMNDIASRTKSGYGLQGDSEFLDLARQLGFHIGSEKIASYEFEIITDKMSQLYPELVFDLKSKILVKGINAFSWFEFHGSVEDAHANYALDAAQILVDYTGSRDLDLQKSVIKEIEIGFNNFSQLQDDFFKNYIKSNYTQNECYNFFANDSSAFLLEI